LRNTTDVLRRAFDSTLANWPLIAIRIAENFVLALLFIGSIIAAVVPVGIAAAFSNFDLKNSEEPAQAIATLIVDHWPFIAYVLLVVTIVLILLVAIHSFVEAGCARVFVDAERNATDAVRTRESFSTFNMDRWLRGGRASWWTVFWIYNIVWGLGGLVLLIPLMMTIAALFMVSEAGGRVAVACGGLFLTFLVVIPVAIVMAVLNQKAITVAVARAAAARDAVRAGWTEIKRDFSRHFAVAFIAFVIALGGSMVIGSFTAPFSIIRNIGHSPFSSIAFAPAQIVSSIAQSVFSAAVGLWFMAAYVALTEEK
jgi:hypothetical protein